MEGKPDVSPNHVTPENHSQHPQRSGPRPQILQQRPDNSAQQLVESVQHQLRPELVAQRAVFVQQIPIGDSTTLGLIPLQRSAELTQQQHQSPEIIAVATHPTHQLQQQNVVEQPTHATTVQIIQHHVVPPHNVVPIVTRPSAEIIHQQHNMAAENVVVARSEVVLQSVEQQQQSAEFLAANEHQPEVIVSQEDGIIISEHQHKQQEQEQESLIAVNVQEGEEVVKNEAVTATENNISSSHLNKEKQVLSTEKAHTQPTEESINLSLIVQSKEQEFKERLQQEAKADDEINHELLMGSALDGIVRTLQNIRAELELLGIEITTREDTNWVGSQLHRLGGLYSAVEESIKNLKNFENNHKKGSKTKKDVCVQVGSSIVIPDNQLKGEVKEEKLLHRGGEGGVDVDLEADGDGGMKAVETVKIEVDPDGATNFPEGIQGLRMAQAYITSKNIELKGNDEELDSKYEEGEEEGEGYNDNHEDDFVQDDSQYTDDATFNPENNATATRKTLKKKKSVRCHVCKKLFKKASLLRKHLMENHEQESLPQCDICSKTFLTMKQLKHHSLNHTEKEMLECEFCKKVLHSKQSMKRHRATHTGEGMHECDICHKKFAIAATLKSHKMVTHLGIKPYACSTCGKRFAKPIHLKSHQVVHTGEKPFKCDLCDKSYSNSGHLWTHKANHHEGFRKPKPKVKEPAIKTEEEKKKIMCGECGKLFASAASLKVHEKIHTGEGRKKIMCQECGKWFASSISLKVHERIHTGEKPYKCDICNKAFAQYSALIAHQDVHNREKKYTCDICSKSFYHKVSLHLHLKRHTAPKSYPCDVCGKSFTENYNLKRHQITHTGEKPYDCDICGRGFTQPQLLKQHMPVHTGERAFKCTTCGKAFTQSSSLSVHRKKYHPDTTFVAFENPK